MKNILTISAAAFALACASSTPDRSPTAEQRERMDEERAEAQGEPGSEPIPSQFDRDGDGVVEDAELKQAGVSEGAIDRLDGEHDGEHDAEHDAEHDGSPAHASDAEITARIRDKIAANDDLSSKAKTVRINTTNGKVTLSGPVESAEEKSRVESTAREVSGSDVDNRIVVPR